MGANPPLRVFHVRVSVWLVASLVMAAASACSADPGQPDEARTAQGATVFDAAGVVSQRAPPPRNCEPSLTSLCGESSKMSPTQASSWCATTFPLREGVQVLILGADDHRLGFGTLGGAFYNSDARACEAEWEVLNLPASDGVLSYQIGDLPPVYFDLRDAGHLVLEIPG